jgi:hypothetical protein
MISFYSLFTGVCLLVLIAGVDVFLYKESMLEALGRIMLKSNTTGKAYAYGFFWLTILLTVGLDIYRLKK